MSDESDSEPENGPAEESEDSENAGRIVHAPFSIVTEPGLTRNLYAHADIIEAFRTFAKGRWLRQDKIRDQFSDLPILELVKSHGQVMGGKRRSVKGSGKSAKRPKHNPESSSHSTSVV